MRTACFMRPHWMGGGHVDILTRGTGTEMEKWDDDELGPAENFWGGDGGQRGKGY